MSGRCYYVPLLAPSPCERLSRLRVVWASLTSQRPSARLLLGWQGVPVFRLGFRFRHTSVSGFPLSWLIIRIPYRPPRNRWDLSSSRRFSFPMPCASDLVRPSGISPRQNLRPMFVFSVVRLVSRRCHAISIIIPTCRFLCIGFRCVDDVATCIFALNEAEWLRGGASPLWPRVNSDYASRLLFACTAGLNPPIPLRQPRKTRYGWVAGPCPTGTFTLQEPPRAIARSSNQLNLLIIKNDQIMVNIILNNRLAILHAIALKNRQA